MFSSGDAIMTVILTFGNSRGENKWNSTFWRNISCTQKLYERKIGCTDAIAYPNLEKEQRKYWVNVHTCGASAVSPDGGYGAPPSDSSYGAPPGTSTQEADSSYGAPAEASKPDQTYGSPATSQGAGSGYASPPVNTPQDAYSVPSAEPIGHSGKNKQAEKVTS